jgi:hypothetical protein
MDAFETLLLLTKECERLLRVAPPDPRVQQDAAAINEAFAALREGGTVDLDAVDDCIRRIRVAATSGKYPEHWPL